MKTLEAGLRAEQADLSRKLRFAALSILTLPFVGATLMSLGVSREVAVVAAVAGLLGTAALTLRSRSVHADQPVLIVDESAETEQHAEMLRKRGLRVIRFGAKEYHTARPRFRAALREEPNVIMTSPASSADLSFLDVKELAGFIYLAIQEGGPKLFLGRSQELGCLTDLIAHMHRPHTPEIEFRFTPQPFSDDALERAVRDILAERTRADVQRQPGESAK